MTEAPPRPWKSGRKGVEDANGKLVAKPSLAYRESAEYHEIVPLIVRAVNRDGLFEEMREALVAANHALRSYQCGNAATELAEEMADFIDLVLTKIAESS